MKYVPPVGGADNDPYIDGNPSTGVEGSAVPAAAIEHSMREILAVITAAGIEPSEANLDQLLAALRSAGVFQTPTLGDRTTKAATMACFSQEFGASLAANGWQKLPSGLIVQWGSGATAGGSAGITYPLQFPNAVFSTQVCTAGSASASSAVYTWGMSSGSVTGISVYCDIGSTGAAAGAVSFRWIAIGY